MTCRLQAFYCMTCSPPVLPPDAACSFAAASRSRSSGLPGSPSRKIRCLTSSGLSNPENMEIAMRLVRPQSPVAVPPGLADRQPETVSSART